VVGLAWAGGWTLAWGLAILGFGVASMAPVGIVTEADAVSATAVCTKESRLRRCAARATRHGCESTRPGQQTHANCPLS